MSMVSVKSKEYVRLISIIVAQNLPVFKEKWSRGMNVALSATGPGVELQAVPNYATVFLLEAVMRIVSVKNKIPWTSSTFTITDIREQ